MSINNTDTHLRLPQLLLGLAAVAIIATGTVYTMQRFGKSKESRCALVDAYVKDGIVYCPVPPTCETFAPCPPLYTNSVNAHVSVETTKDWKMYINNTDGFSFQYPKEFTESMSEGNSIFTADTQGTISLVFKSEVFDPKNVQDFLGKMDTTIVSVGSRTGYQYRIGDAGCVGTRVQMALRSKILRIGFDACFDQDTNPIGENTALMKKILSTFSFTE